LYHSWVSLVPPSPHPKGHKNKEKRAKIQFIYFLGQAHHSLQHLPLGARTTDIGIWHLAGSHYDMFMHTVRISKHNQASNFVLTPSFLALLSLLLLPSFCSVVWCGV